MPTTCTSPRPGLRRLLSAALAACALALVPALASANSLTVRAEPAGPVEIGERFVVIGEGFSDPQSSGLARFSRTYIYISQTESVCPATTETAAHSPAHTELWINGSNSQEPHSFSWNSRRWQDRPVEPRAPGTIYICGYLANHVVVGLSSRPELVATASTSVEVRGPREEPAPVEPASTPPPEVPPAEEPPGEAASTGPDVTRPAFTAQDIARLKRQRRELVKMRAYGQRVEGFFWGVVGVSAGRYQTTAAGRLLIRLHPWARTVWLASRAGAVVFKGLNYLVDRRIEQHDAILAEYSGKERLGSGSAVARRGYGEHAAAPDYTVIASAPRTRPARIRVRGLGARGRVAARSFAAAELRLGALDSCISDAYLRGNAALDRGETLLAQRQYRAGARCASRAAVLSRSMPRRARALRPHLRRIEPRVLIARRTMGTPTGVTRFDRRAIGELARAVPLTARERRRLRTSGRSGARAPRPSNALVRLASVVSAGAPTYALIADRLKEAAGDRS